MKFKVQYEMKVTKTAIVEASSEAEAIKLVRDGDFEDEWEEDSDGFHVTDVSSMKS